MKRTPLIELAVGSALIAAVAVQPAQAYIDPNSAGPLYQLLFPLLIAIGSAIAALRRYIARAWVRVTSAVVAAVRGPRPRA